MELIALVMQAGNSNSAWLHLALLQASLLAQLIPNTTATHTIITYTNTRPVKIVTIEIIVMVSNNCDVNYLHSLQEKLHFMYLILGQMSC